MLKIGKVGTIPVVVLGTGTNIMLFVNSSVDASGTWSNTIVSTDLGNLGENTYSTFFSDSDCIYHQWNTT